MDYTKMSGAQGMPPAMSSVVMIAHRGDEKRTYSLYTNKKKYMVSDETDEGYYAEPVVAKTFVANETIDRPSHREIPDYDNLRGRGNTGRLYLECNRPGRYDDSQRNRQRDGQNDIHVNGYRHGSTAGRSL